MAGTHHQTIRIMRGRHRSPDHGACVMELASLLAGEPFSDRPSCVDPVIATYLRALNDRLGHHDRQRLLPYAAAAVGTRRGAAVTRVCAGACRAYAGAGRTGVVLALGTHGLPRPRQGAAELAARTAVARDDLDGALALLDELLRLAGAQPPSEAAPLPLAVGRLTQVG